MEYLYVSVIFLLSLIEEVLFYRVIFRKELVKASWEKLMPLFLEYIVFIIMTACEVPAVYMSIVIIGTDFYVGCIYTKMGVIENIKYWCVSVLLIALTEQIILTMFSSDTADTITYGMWNVLACVIVSAMLLIAGWFIKDTEDEGKVLSWKVFLIVIPIVAGIEICFSYMTYLLDTLPESFQKNVGLIIFLLAAIGICAALVIVLHIFRQKEYFERKSIMENKYNQQQREYFLHLLEKEEETRRFRHDVVNHLLCMQNAMENKNYQEVTAYLADVLSEVDTISCKQYDMGDEIVNVILNYYLTPIQKKCEISAEGYIGKLENITQMDLCTIFSNVIKNAAEAVGECGKIRIEGKRGKQFAKIVIGNSCFSEVKLSKEGLPITIKEDKGNHGFGIANMQRAIQRNGGTFTYKVSDGWFEVELIFNIDDRTQ